VNGTALVDNQLNQKWRSPSPIQSSGSSLENPHSVALADLLGQGRPQVISRSDRRSIGIQDILDGSWMVYTSIYGFGAMRGWPIPVDADGDGHGDVIVNYGSDDADATRLDYDAQLPPANFLIFSSDHWQKIPQPGTSICTCQIKWTGTWRLATTICPTKRITVGCSSRCANSATSTTTTMSIRTTST